MENRTIVVSMFEWGPDMGPMTHAGMHKLFGKKLVQKAGWRIPSPEDFELAWVAGVKDFKCPTENYWTTGDHGDARTIRPMTPLHASTCNSDTVRNRVRFVRRIFASNSQI
jgi:hypothetical protein